MSVHSVSLKGKRIQNEDKHNIIVNLEGQDKSISNINYYGIYDGHGGKFVSKFLSEQLPQCFTDKRVVYPLKKTFVKEIYEFFQNMLKKNHYKNSFNTGATCLIVVQYKSEGSDFLNVLNTGDTRCIICRNNFGIPLTKDHKPNWPEERIRIQSLGGEIKFDGNDWRITDLSVSRAFGDIKSEPFLTNMPDIFRYKITQEDKFIVLACDGVWDVLTNQDVVNFILDSCYNIETGERINKNINIAKMLGNYAIQKGSTDNITVIVVFLN